MQNAGKTGAQEGTDIDSENRNPPVPHAWSRADAAGLLLVAAIAAWAFVQSRGGWLDPIIDAGRDLYLPEAIRHGTKLYRDILYFYPPLTPYLLAAVTAIAGSSLSAYTAIGVAIAAATAFALYWLTRSAGGVVPATIAASLFAALSFTGATSWGCNFIFPYAHAATIGMALTLLFAASLASYLFVSRRRATLALALTFGFLASWTKIELALLVSVSIVIVWVLHRIPMRWLAGYLAVSALSLALVNWHFRDAPAGAHWLFDNVLSSSLLGGASAAFFYRQVSGIAAWQVALPEIALSASMIVAFVASLHLLDRFRRQSTSGAKLARLACILAAAILTVALAGNQTFRGWSLIQLALIPFAFGAGRRRPLPLLLTVSLLASWRIALNLAPEWYGFVLIVPTYALMAYVLFVWLPERGVYEVRTALLSVPLLALTAWSGLASQRTMYAAKRHEVVTLRGTFNDHNPQRAVVLQQLLEHLDSGAARALVVIPEGLAINYFSRIANPMLFQTFTPVESAAPETEQRIIAEFERTKPELVAIVPRDVREFGYRAWGVDYHADLRKYLESHYRIERRWTEPRFPLLLLRRSETIQYTSRDE
ncbi:MAG: hypothetical protein ACYC7A_04490 [Thermoanaerobaculia bacterium]